MNFKRGFTLAEVLITLSIIGVVAALTIPSLIVKNQEKETVTRLKKSYSVLSNAYSLAKIDYGNPQGWDIGITTTKENSAKFADKFTQYLSIIKRCDGTPGCFPNVDYLQLSGTLHGKFDEWDNVTNTILSDGTLMMFIGNGLCQDYNDTIDVDNMCGTIYVDTNGAKKPNVTGKDSFEFMLTQKGIIPHGVPNDKLTPLETQCREGSGQACTAWILLKGNMDYPPAGTGWE